MPSTGVACEDVLLGSDLCHKHLGQRVQPEFKSRIALRRNYAAISLDYAGTRVESIPGPTDFLVRSLRQRGRSQCVIYWHLLFAGGVNEITLHPRPASHSFAGNVETDHPHAVHSD